MNETNETEEQDKTHSFQSEDFDAYLPNKWNSNMYTLARRRVKEKLELLGAELAAGFEASELKLVRHSSDEFPSFWNRNQVDRQWLFFSRDEDARAELTDIIDRERTLADTLADPTPMFRHIFLGVSVSEESLEMGIWMHHDAWVDRRNFINLCADDTARDALIGLLAELPEHFELGIDTGDMGSPKEFDAATLKSLGDAFEEDKAWFFLGARLPKDQVLVLGADIFAEAAEIVRTLIPVYRRIAWSPSNDLISIDSILAERSEAIKQSREELDRERAERAERIREQHAAGAAMKEEIAERIRETAAWRSREIAAKRAQAMKAAAQAKEEDARAKAEAMAAQWGLGGSKSETEKPEAKPAAEAPAPARAPAEAPRRSEDDRQDRGRSFQSRGPRDNKGGRADKPRFQMPSREEGKKVSPSRYVVDVPHAAPASLGEFTVGAHIEVTKGFLKGRRGTIHEIDEKGWLKVSFGLVSSRLEPSEMRCLGPDEPLQQRPNRKKGASK